MSRRKIFTQEVLDQIKALVAEGYPATEIAPIVGCKYNSLTVVCSGHGISLKGPTPRARIPRGRVRPFDRTPPPVEVLAEREAAVARAEERLLTARLMGDPLPGRSALDRTKGANPACVTRSFSAADASSP